MFGFSTVVLRSTSHLVLLADVTWCLCATAHSPMSAEHASPVAMNRTHATAMRAGDDLDALWFPKYKADLGR